MRSVEDVIGGLILTSGEVPVQCIKNAKNPIAFISFLLKKNGIGGVHYSTSLKNDLFLIQNALKKEIKKEEEATNHAVWKLWEQVKIPEEEAMEIISRCDKQGFSSAGESHILIKIEGRYFLYKRNSVPTKNIF